VEDVVRRLLAVQAQDPRGARLAIRARSRGLVAADVDRALTTDRSVVVTWLNRGTLHLVCAEDLALLQSLTTPRLRTGNARRLAQEGVSPEQAERGTKVVLTALDAGPMTRAELRERLVSAGVPVAGQALVHVLMRTCLGGDVVRGPVVGADHAYVRVGDWLGRLPPPPDRETALAELARRYLEGHGPATERDLARWAGIALGEARRGFTGVRGLREREGGLASLSTARPMPLPPPRLLGPFEPVLLGWVDRTPIVGQRGDLVTSNGIFRPFALVDGRAAASWSLTGGLQPFSPLEPHDVTALDAEAVDVRRFLGTARYR
jgi:hypothetical protein